jgi:hypothetical protein
MKRADPSKEFFRSFVKKLRKFSCAPFGLVQPNDAAEAERHVTPVLGTDEMLNVCSLRQRAPLPRTVPFLSARGEGSWRWCVEGLGGGQKAEVRRSQPRPLTPSTQTGLDPWEGPQEPSPTQMSAKHDSSKPRLNVIIICAAVSALKDTREYKARNKTQSLSRPKSMKL